LVLALEFVARRGISRARVIYANTFNKVPVELLLSPPRIAASLIWASAIAVFTACMLALTADAPLPPVDGTKSCSRSAPFAWLIPFALMRSPKYAAQGGLDSLLIESAISQKTLMPAGEGQAGNHAILKKMQNQAEY
jgi:hypothetical protein